MDTYTVKSVKGASSDFKSYVLDDEGYTWIGNDYKRKSKVIPTEIYVTVGKYKNGRIKNDVFDLNIGKKVMTLGEIKKVFARGKENPPLLDKKITSF